MIFKDSFLKVRIVLPRTKMLFWRIIYMVTIQLFLKIAWGLQVRGKKNFSSLKLDKAKGNLRNLMCSPIVYNLQKCCLESVSCWDSNGQFLQQRIYTWYMIMFHNKISIIIDGANTEYLKLTTERLQWYFAWYNSLLGNIKSLIPFVPGFIVSN